MYIHDSFQRREIKYVKGEIQRLHLLLDLVYICLNSTDQLIAMLSPMYMYQTEEEAEEAEEEEKEEEKKDDNDAIMI